MQILVMSVQALFAAGSHSEPRFVDEPHTLWGPDEVVTSLHWSNWSAFLHASGSAGLHAM